MLGLLVTVLLATAPAAAWAEPVRVEAGASTVPLAGRFELYADDNPSLTLDEVIRRNDFHRPVREGLSGGIRWYRVTVLRAADAAPGWILAFGEPDIDDVRMFVVHPGGGVSETRLGRHIPNAQLPLAARQHMARLDLPAEVPVTVYLRLASKHKIRFEQAALWSPEALILEEASQSARMALHMGIMVLLVAGYALCGLWVRDRAMLLYAAYVSTILCRAATHTGMVTLLFPSAGAQTNYILGTIGLLGGLAAFVFMWDRVLGLRTAMPVMHRIYLAVGSLALLSVVLADSWLFPIVAMSTHAVMFAASVTSIVLAVVMLRRGADNVLLKWYVAAFLPIVVVGATRLAAPLLPFIPIELGRLLDVSANTTHIGILGLALAYRLGLMQRDRVRIREELVGERLVRERLRAFIDMVTHEFKTPLAVIDSAAQMLELQAADRPAMTERLSNIRRAVKRLVRLIETCLAGERYENVHIRPMAVSPLAIAQQAAERNSLPGQCAVAVVNHGVPDSCVADPEMLAIALDALVDNAQRYGAPGKDVEIHLDQQNDQVVFSVHDHGPGVPVEEAERVFEKFYRCPSTTSVAGTGIGLHLVRTIAELHGGGASYAPRPGGGAIFSVSIPQQALLA